ncbi:hypothetical protein [Proteiniphilum sp.]|uniref:hypothetical protein n=1 Tax=Proteiniphilum sp. TaxID=1926877 RepID=UPI002B1F450F|nr:hypothetical protein [Proteiniphilum sp.]MEA4918733.1 hypothetical protein [Proteiniphilum sp.]
MNTASKVTLARYSYDEPGRVRTKTLARETSSYLYNIRGWLTQVTGTKFNQTLTYNAPMNGVTPAKALYKNKLIN